MSLLARIKQEQGRRGEWQVSTPSTQPVRIPAWVERNVNQTPSFDNPRRGAKALNNG